MFEIQAKFTGSFDQDCRVKFVGSSKYYSQWSKFYIDCQSRNGNLDDFF